MDPNATLAGLRKTIAESRENSANIDAGEQLELLVGYAEALDEWLTKGGFAPDAWKPQDKPAPGVHRLLDLSTAHLTEAEMRAVSEDAEGLPRCIDHEYGAWVNVPDEELDGYGTDDVRAANPNVFAVIELARSLGARWINFDADGDKLPNLPTYEW